MQKLKIILSESCFAFLNKYHIQDTITKKKPKKQNHHQPKNIFQLDNRAKYQSASILDNQS